MSKSTQLHLDSLLAQLEQAKQSVSTDFSDAFDACTKLNFDPYLLLPTEMIEKIYKSHTEVLRIQHFNNPDRVCSPKEMERAKKLMALEDGVPEKLFSPATLIGHCERPLAEYPEVGLFYGKISKSALAVAIVEKYPGNTVRETAIELIKQLDSVGDSISMANAKVTINNVYNSRKIKKGAMTGETTRLYPLSSEYGSVKK